MFRVVFSITPVWKLFWGVILSVSSYDHHQSLSHEIVHQLWGSAWSGIFKSSLRAQSELEVQLQCLPF